MAPATDRRVDAVRGARERRNQRGGTRELARGSGQLRQRDTSAITFRGDRGHSVVAGFGCASWSLVSMGLAGASLGISPTKNLLRRRGTSRHDVGFP